MERSQSTGRLAGSASTGFCHRGCAGRFRSGGFGSRRLVREPGLGGLPLGLGCGGGLGGLQPRLLVASGFRLDPCQLGASLLVGDAGLLGRQTGVLGREPGLLGDPNRLGNGGLRGGAPSVARSAASWAPI